MKVGRIWNDPAVHQSKNPSGTATATRGHDVWKAHHGKTSISSSSTPSLFVLLTLLCLFLLLLWWWWLFSCFFVCCCSILACLSHSWLWRWKTVSIARRTSQRLTKGGGRFNRLSRANILNNNHFRIGDGCVEWPDIKSIICVCLCVCVCVYIEVM